MKTQSDHEWIGNLKQGNDQAIQALWEMVFTYGTTLARYYGQEDDIGREAAIAAFHRIHDRGVYQFRFQCPFPAYCRRIVVNEVKRRLRKLPPPPVELAEELHKDKATNEPDNLLAAGQLIRERLEPCLERLSARKRKIVHQRYFAGHSPEKIATDMELTRNHVNQILYRARRDLRACLEDRGFLTTGDVLGL